MSGTSAALTDAERDLLRRVMACGARASGRLWDADEVTPAPSVEALEGLRKRGLIGRTDFSAGTLWHLLPEGAAVAFSLGLVLGLPEVKT